MSKHDEAIEKIYNRFINDPAAFSVALTNIFQDPDGTPQQLYPLQINFLNNEKKKGESIVVVVKCRQCVVGETLISTPSGMIQIKDLVYSTYRGEILTNDNDGNIQKDKVIDTWYAGYKEVYDVELYSGEKIRATNLHKIKTIDGFKTISSLSINDKVEIVGGFHRRIKSISYCGKENTYDITTEKYHSYIANGILVHNSGFSTSIKAKALHHAYFGLTPNVLIASASQMQATKVLREIKEAVYSMPEFLRPEFSKETETEIHFKSGAKILSLPTNPQTVRGFSGLTFWDEAGVFNRKDSERFFSAIYPSISKGHQMIIVSTPLGKDNVFYDLCNPKLNDDGSPVKGIRAGKIIKVLWNQVPHIKKFIEEEGIEDYSSKTFLQEYCCEFLEDSEDSLFNMELIDGKFFDKTDSFLDLKFLDSMEGSSISSDAIIDLSKFYDKIYIGYDPAISESKDSDGSAVCAFGIKGDEWKLIFVRNLPKGLSQTKQCEYVSRLALCLRADKVGFDSTGGMGLTFKERLEDTPIRNKLVPVIFSPNLKQQGYMEIKHKMEAHKMKSPEHNELRKQILNLGYNPVTGKIAAMGSWRKNKDDLISSILCAHECKSKKNLSGFTFI